MTVLFSLQLWPSLQWQLDISLFINWSNLKTISWLLPFGLDLLLGTWSTISFITLCTTSTQARTKRVGSTNFNSIIISITLEESRKVLAFPLLSGTMFSKQLCPREKFIEWFLLLSFKYQIFNTLFSFKFRLSCSWV